MKRLIILSILIISLITMSSAYAMWTDSNSVVVTANSGVSTIHYVGRNNPSNVTYTQQGGAVSTTNPYSYIEEYIVEMKPNTNSSRLTVEYTIQNTGTVPVAFDGISVGETIYYDTDSWSSYADQQILLSARIQYTLDINNTTYSYLVDDIYSHPGQYISFTSVDNVLEVGETCLLTVEYYRVRNTYRRNWLSLWKDETLDFSLNY